MTDQPGERLPQPVELRDQSWPEGTQPLLTVTCTTYNQERWIAPCLDGILAQKTSFPVEILVHDDCSTDGTVDILESYRVRYPGLVRLILQDENQWSRNRAIRPIFTARARGEYLAHCDGDDLWLDAEKLEKQVGFLQRHPEFVLSFHDAIRMDAQGGVVAGSLFPERCLRDYSPDELRILKWGWMLMGTIVCRNLVRDFPPEYDLIPNGDNFFPMLLGKYGGARFQAEIGPLGYRQHGESVWSSRSVSEKHAMHLRTYLLICAYFVRIGEHRNAGLLASSRLRHYVVEFLKQLNADRS